MAKKICRTCGKAYDVDEWVECPECAKKEYEEGKKYPKPMRYITPYKYQEPFPMLPMDPIPIMPRRRDEVWCKLR